MMFIFLLFKHSINKVNVVNTITMRPFLGVHTIYVLEEKKEKKYHTYSFGNCDFIFIMAVKNNNRIFHSHVNVMKCCLFIYNTLHFDHCDFIRTHYTIEHHRV